MDRVIKIVFYIVALIFVYSIASVVFNSCKSTSADLVEKANEGIESSSTLDDGEEDLNDEFFNDGDSDSSNDLADELFQEADVEFDQEIEESKPSYSEPTRSNPTPTYSTGSGKYMVIAGNFLVQNNAGNMVNKLKNLGYNDAESIVFDHSQYYTVLANRTDDYDRALSISNRLKSNGIDNYVKSQTF